MSRKPRKGGKANTDITNYMKPSEVDSAYASVAGKIVQFEENKTPLPVKPPDTNVEISNILKDLSNEVKGLTKAVGLNTKGISEFKDGIESIKTVKNTVLTLSDDLKALKTSVETPSEETEGYLSELGDHVSVLERNKEATETWMLDSLTEKLK